MSVLSFPDRGQGGNPRWRGNCSPRVYEHLFKLLSPRTFVDAMVGSGTSVEVAARLGIEALGLDLHCGFNALRERIRDRLPAHWGGGADLNLTHPPYHNIIVYSGAVWGEAHPDDLSRCPDVDTFLERLAQVMLNQRDSTRVGGTYGTILGDVREKGQYHALTSDLQAYLPRRERRAILIKVQHGIQSGQQSYGRLRYGRILHEYVLLYERQEESVYWVLAATHQQQRQISGGTWRAIVRHVISGLGHRFTNQQVYQAVMDSAPERVQASPHWQAKVRQILQVLGDLENTAPGHWTKAA